MNISLVDHLLGWIFGVALGDLSWGGAALDLDNEVETVERKYDRRLFLKIKLKNLRDEVAMIRDYEDQLAERIEEKESIARFNGHEAMIAHERMLISQMADHRRRDIREETRATLLAYGYIRGKAYAQLEPRVRYEPPAAVKKRVERVAKMVNKYSTMGGCLMLPMVMEEKIREWMGVEASGLRKAA